MVRLGLCSGVGVAAAVAATIVGCRPVSFNEISENESSGPAEHHAQAHEARVASHDEAPQEPGGQGKAVFPAMEHNFGEVEQGAKVVHTFKVRNEGGGVLHLKRVRGS